MTSVSFFAVGKISQILDVKAPDITVGPWDVIQSIENIHQVPLRPLSISLGRENSYPGEGAYYDVPGEPIRIIVAPTARYPELTLAHEIGHLLDHQFLGAPWSYASEDTAFLTLWRERIETSEAFQTLYRTQNAIQQGESEFEVEVADGIVHTFRFAPGLSLNLGVVHYLLKPRELFARSYAQYIVVRSQHNLLKYGLDAQRNFPIDAVLPRHWEDEDFEPIAEAFDTMFRERGWKL